MADQVLDVRPLRKPDKHPGIFEAYDALAVGGSFVLINNHARRHLQEELDTGHAGSYAWTYLDKGPDEWRIRIGKLASTTLPRTLAETRAVTADVRTLGAAGAVRRLQMRQRDLDSNIIRMQPGASIDAHTGPRLDVLLIVLDAGGRLTTELELRPGALVWRPRPPRRQFTVGRDGLSYVTVRRRPQSLVLDAAARNSEGQRVMGRTPPPRAGTRTPACRRLNAPVPPGHGSEAACWAGQKCRQCRAMAAQKHRQACDFGPARPGTLTLQPLERVGVPGWPRDFTWQAGTGTHANDDVAGQLAGAGAPPGPGCPRLARLSAGKAESDSPSSVPGPEQPSAARARTGAAPPGSGAQAVAKASGGAG